MPRTIISELLDVVGGTGGAEETAGGDLGEEEDDEQELPSHGWRAHKASRERVKRVLEEMEWHEGGRGKPLTSCRVEAGR